MNIGDKITLIIMAVIIVAVISTGIWVYYYNMNNVFVEPTEQNLKCDSIAMNEFFVTMPQDQKEYLFNLCYNKTK